jgi:N-acetylmuramoyl-L-alanine amidase
MKLIFPIILCCLASVANAYTAAERECLALNIYHEARGEPEEGQLAVAHVTLNRVRSPRFPNNICSVVWQSGQFSWTRDGRSNTPRDRRAWQEAQRLASIAINWHRAGDDFSYGATFYHADYVRPYWADIFQEVVTIGAHIFYIRQ